MATAAGGRVRAPAVLPTAKKKDIKHATSPLTYVRGDCVDLEGKLVSGPSFDQQQAQAHPGKGAPKGQKGKAPAADSTQPGIMPPSSKAPGPRPKAWQASRPQASEDVAQEVAPAGLS
eukprot:2070430-Heterocapsa_arctica.AAC.1